MSIDFHNLSKKFIRQGNQYGKLIFDDHERMVIVRETFAEFAQNGEFLIGTYEQEFLFDRDFCQIACSDDTVKIVAQCLMGHCYSEQMAGMCAPHILSGKEEFVSKMLNGIVLYEDSLHAMTDGGVTKEAIRRLIAFTLAHERRHSIQSKRLVRFATEKRMAAFAHEMQGYTSIPCEQDADMAGLEFGRAIACYLEE